MADQLPAHGTPDGLLREPGSPPAVLAPVPTSHVLAGVAAALGISAGSCGAAVALTAADATGPALIVVVAGVVGAVQVATQALRRPSDKDKDDHDPADGDVREILDLVKAKTITADEAARLIEAAQLRPPKPAS